MNFKTIKFLRQKASLIPIFDGIGIGMLEELLQISIIVRFDEDQVVLEAGKKVEDIYIILSGQCIIEMACPEGRFVKKELASSDVFGVESLFVPSLLTNKVTSKTELVCVTINILALRSNQELINSLTPNMTRTLIHHLHESDNHLSKLTELYSEQEVETNDIVPRILENKLSKLTRLMMSSGKVVVVSKPDERRLRREQVTVQQLNDEYMAKIEPEALKQSKQA